MKTIRNFNPFYGMSQSQSMFIKWVGGIVATLIAAMIIGGIYFYRTTAIVDAVQNERIKRAELNIESLQTFDKYFPSNGEFQRAVRGVDMKTQANAAEIETVRKEVREDLKDINKKIDRLIEMQLDDIRTAKN